jgi:DNA-binding SARP family transcriptional activator/WD40 repeat protein
MEFRVLGPVEVAGTGRTVRLGRRERGLLAALILSIGKTVSSDRLVDALWGERPPRTAGKTLQNYVLRLRKALGASVIETQAPGYRLVTAVDAIDAHRFEELIRIGRTAAVNGAPARAARSLRDALQLWRGDPFEELAGWAPAEAEAARLGELRRVAAEELVDAELACGRHAECVAELESMVAAEPLRERRWAMLMLAFYRCGRQADALRAYQRARATLVEELGIEPGPELRALEQAVVAQDASLDPPSAVIEPERVPPARADGGIVFILFSDLVGSTELLDRLGDDAADELRRTHFKLLRDAVDAHGGQEVKNLGDGLMVVFTSAVDAVSCAVEIQRAVAEYNSTSSQQLDVRVGLHVGEPIRDEDDFFGTPVVVARRLCDAASPDQILASDLVRELVGRRGAFVFSDVPPVTVNGLREPLVAVEITGQATAGAAAERSPDGQSPYKGLVAFEAEDREVFFGRETVVEGLVARLETTRLLAVVGGSGSGKSSVVRAGILAAVRHDALPGSAAWPTVLMSPGAHPLAELAAQLSLSSGVAAGSLLDDLEHDARALDLAARQLAASSPTSSRVVLVIDQFEEIFTLCRDTEERRRFIDALACAATQTDGVTTIVNALRADFYGHCGGYPDLGRLLEAGTALLGPMRADELRAAIEGPARVAGLRLEPGLTEIIVRDLAGEPGNLPLLSHALLETWKRRRHRTLTLEGYRDAGGVHGAIAQTAEAVYNRLDPPQQAVARNIFVRLTGLGEGTEDTARRVPRSELTGGSNGSGDLDGVLDALTDARLVTISGAGIQVAHEALVREWPRLRSWLDDDREGLRTHRHLTHATLDWATLGRDPSELYRGPRLAAAAEWADSNRDPALNPLEHEFLDASRHREQRVVQEQATRVRRLHRLLAGVALALVVALIAGTFALVQRRRADDRAEVADATRLGAQAVALAGKRPDLALNLAVEAHQLHPTVDTEGALETALAATPPGLERLVHFDPPARFAGISNDGDLVAAPGDDGTVRLIDTGSGHEVRRLVGHHTGALVATFTGDDRHVAAAGDDGRVTVWDVATGRRLGSSLDAGGGPAYGAFDPTDGTRLYTAGHDGAVTAWNLTDPERPQSVELFRIPLPEQNPLPAPPSSRQLPLVVLPSGDGGRLLVGPVLGPSYLWDVRSGALVAVVAGAPGGWSPDGSTVAIGRVNDVVLVDAATGAQQGEALAGFDLAVPVMAFSPDGRRLAAGDIDGTIRVFDLATRQEASRLALHEDLALPQFLADGRLFTRSSRLAAIVRLDAVPVAPMATVLGGHGGNTNVNFTADGTGVVTGDDQGQARRWDAQTGAERGAPFEAGGSGARARPSPDLRTVLVEPEHGALGLYDAKTGRLRAALPTDSDGYRNGASPWSRDGTLLAHAGSTSVYSTLWNLADPDHPRAVAHLRPDGPPDQPVAWTEFSADGRRIAVTRYQADTATVFATATGRRVSVLKTTNGVIGSFKFSPDGRTLAAAVPAGATGSVDFFDVATGNRRARLALPFGASWVAYARGGTRIATTTDIRPATLSDPGAATPSDPGASSLRLWDTASLEPVGDAIAFPSTGGRAVASPDGRRLAITGHDLAVLWDLDPSRWEAMGCRIANRPLTRAEWDHYLPNRAYHPAC